MCGRGMETVPGECTGAHGHQGGRQWRHLEPGDLELSSSSAPEAERGMLSRSPVRAHGHPVVGGPHSCLAALMQLTAFPLPHSLPALPCSQQLVLKQMILLNPARLARVSRATPMGYSRKCPRPWRLPGAHPHLAMASCSVVANYV
jgi:hypothetical protein